MIYALLIALAIVFALLGFLVHALFFRGAENAEVKAQCMALQKSLLEKENETREAREEIIKRNALLRNLEQMLSQRNGEIESLRHMALRQESEINSLRKDAEAIRKSLADPEKSGASHDGFARNKEQPDLVTSEPFQHPNNGVLQPDEHKSPDLRSEQKRIESDMASRGAATWRENLSDILKTLDSVGEKGEE